MPHKDIIVNGERWPSVTEILNFWDNAHPKPWITAWRKKHGEKKCNEIRDRAARIGRCFHKAIETGKMPKWKRIANMYKVFLVWDEKQVRTKDELVEQTVIHNKLRYGGTFDRCNYTKISDWKTKPKPDFENVPIQLKAYALAFGYETGCSVPEGELVNVSRNPPHVLTHKVFDLNDPIYEAQWLNRLEFYYKHNGVSNVG